jgi:hypothetical protein
MEFDPNLWLINTHDITASTYSESTSELTFDIFPNPTHGITTIDYTEGISEIQIYSSKGILLSKILPLEYQTTIDFTNYPSGIYYLHIINETKNFISKIIKL